MERTIVWNKKPSRFLAQSLKWTSKDSVLRAERVEKEILEAINDIPTNPEKHSPDKFKKNNPGNFRAFEKLSFGFLTKSQHRKSGYYASGMSGKSQRTIKAFLFLH